jgi:hypothetical protein
MYDPLRIRSCISQLGFLDQLCEFEGMAELTEAGSFDSLF